MRFHLTTYGWNNCANQHTVRDADARDKLRSGPEKQFRRMFTVRSECENPRLEVRPVSRAQTSGSHVVRPGQGIPSP